MNDPSKHRAIKSYVLRQGRLTDGQERALVNTWPQFGLDYLGAARDLDTAFGRNAPKIIEIGFGNGEALLAAAHADPTRDYIGIEVHRPGVGRLLLNADKAHMSNLRVYHHDAVEVLSNEIGDGTLSEVRLYFPDPWHKVRHNKRRIVQPQFVALVTRKLKTGGLFHLATDWAAYAEQMLDVMEAAPCLKNRLGPRAVSPRPDWRIETHFQKRGERLGHDVFDLIYDRID
ncbi:MAG: tRNA (guanosine(46)-N7)-methyltransferase TrmB [Pseudomonadota bacterium]|nr:tRNA (guanosine(46)-N7)-methyltransferase TrmB [Pseudomonadota bacterium]